MPSRRIETGQTIFDVAIMTCGSLENMFALLANPDIGNIEELKPGATVSYPVVKNAVTVFFANYQHGIGVDLSTKQQYLKQGPIKKK